MKMLAFSLFHRLQTSLAWCGHSQPIWSCWGSQTVQPPRTPGLHALPRIADTLQAGMGLDAAGLQGKGLERTQS